MSEMRKILPAPVGLHREACRALQDAIYTYIDDARIFHGKIPATGFHGLPF